MYEIYHLIWTITEYTIVLRNRKIHGHNVTDSELFVRFVQLALLQSHVAAYNFLFSDLENEFF